MEVATIDNGNNNYLDSFPPGYRFCPDDDQLIAHYLQTKVAGGYILPGLIHDVNFYNHTPQQLYDKYKRKGQAAIYFFSPRNKRYPKGHRPDRRVRIEPSESIPDGKVGFWKANGRDQSVRFKGIEVGKKRSLNYFEGTKVNEKKTNWLMQEFVLSNTPWNDIAAANEGGTMQLDEWVLCKLYRNGRGAGKKKKANHGEQQGVQNSNMPQPMNQNAESAASPSLNNINPENPLMQLPASGLMHDQNDGLMSRRPNLPNNNVGALYYWDGNFMQPVLLPAMQHQDEDFAMNMAAMQEEAEINGCSMFPFSVPLLPPLRQPSSESEGS